MADARQVNTNARRLRGSITRVEQTPYDATSPRRLPRATGVSLVLAKTTTSVTGRSGTTLGSGTVSFQKVSGTAISDTGDTATAYNFAAGSISSGKYCSTCVVAGEWFIFSVEC